MSLGPPYVEEVRASAQGAECALGHRDHAGVDDVGRGRARGADRADGRLDRDGVRVPQQLADDQRRHAAAEVRHGGDRIGHRVMGVSHDTHLSLRVSASVALTVFVTLSQMG